MLVLAIALVAGAVVLWRDPYSLVRAEFTRQRLAAGLSKTSVVIDDHRWVYAYSDDAPTGAPTVVMLHGFTGMKENWYPVARRLRGHYRLLVPDLPGWGESQRIAGADYGFVAQSARVARFIKQVADAKGGVVLLGHSMGGGIAALTAARYPDEVARVGLLDAAGVRFADNRFGEQVLAGHNPFAVHDAYTLEHYLGTVYFDAKARPSDPVAGRPASTSHADGTMPRSSKACSTTSVAAANASCRARKRRISASRRCCCGAGRMR